MWHLNGTFWGSRWLSVIDHRCHLCAVLVLQGQASLRCFRGDTHEHAWKWSHAHPHTITVYVHTRGCKNCCNDEMLLMLESLRNTFLDLFTMTCETARTKESTPARRGKHFRLTFALQHAIYKPLLLPEWTQF